jgi:hypothetical protein
MSKLMINNCICYSTLRVNFIDKFFIKNLIKNLLKNKNKIIHFEQIGTEWLIESTAFGRYLVTKKTKYKTLYFCIYKK